MEDGFTFCEAMESEMVKNSVPAETTKDCQELFEASPASPSSNSSSVVVMTAADLEAGAGSEEHNDVVGEPSPVFPHTHSLPLLPGVLTQRSSYVSEK